MSRQVLQGALASHLAAFAAAQVPALPVAYENRKFTPPAGPYLRETLLPAEPAAAALGTDAPNRHRGIYQVDVLGRSGEHAHEGAGAIAAIVDELVTHFKRGTRLTASTGFIITIERASGGPALQDNGRYRVPVSITYRADVAN